MKRKGLKLFVSLMALGTVALFATADSFGKAGGPSGPCNCPPEVELKDGTVCTLIGGCNEPNCYYQCDIDF